MKIRNFLHIGCFVMLAAISPPASAADDREAVNLPPEIQDAFLTEMRGHMGNLDDILTAIAEGNFKEAADIAELKMDFGHSIWEGMAAEGMSADEIRAQKQKMQQGGGQHQPGAGGGRGMGRFMPQGFRDMGQNFHKAAGEFAAKARAVGAQPSAADYRSVIGALEAVTANCQSCHETFRVK